MINCACKVGHVSFSFDIDLGLKFLTFELFSTGNNFCALKDMSSYSYVLFLFKSPEAFCFIQPMATFIECLSCICYVKHWLQPVDAADFNTHSFRKGMATSLSQVFLIMLSLLWADGKASIINCIFQRLRQSFHSCRP